MTDRDLGALGEESGLRGYDNRPKRDALAMNFLKAIQILHFADRTLGLDTIRLQFILPSLMQILNETTKIVTQAHAGSRGLEIAETAVLVSDGHGMIEELVGYLKNYCENQLLRAKLQQNRIQTQLIVVSNHIQSTYKEGFVC
jgi:ABC-type uncharacterized transport system ATPase subunit